MAFVGRLAFEAVAFVGGLAFEVAAFVGRLAFEVAAFVGRLVTVGSGSFAATRLGLGVADCCCGGSVASVSVDRKGRRE